MDLTPINRSKSNKPVQFNLPEGGKKFVRSSNQKLSTISKASVLNIMNKSNIDNFKDQLEKYDVRRKSMRMRPDLLIKLKNGIQAANRIMKKSKTNSHANSEAMNRKTESKKHSRGLIGFNS